MTTLGQYSMVPPFYVTGPNAHLNRARGTLMVHYIHSHKLLLTSHYFLPTAHLSSTCKITCSNRFWGLERAT